MLRFQGALQASELIEDPDRALKDGVLDASDLPTGIGLVTVRLERRVKIG